MFRIHHCIGKNHISCVKFAKIRILRVLWIVHTHAKKKKKAEKNWISEDRGRKGFLPSNHQGVNIYIRNPIPPFSLSIYLSIYLCISLSLSLSLSPIQFFKILISFINTHQVYSRCKILFKNQKLFPSCLRKISDTKHWIFFLILSDTAKYYSGQRFGSIISYI